MTTALITGASSGIGTVYARRLAARGYHLVLVARATDWSNSLAADLRKTHGVAIKVITADLTDAKQIEAVGQRLRAEPTDLLINNAGAGLAGGLAHAAGGKRAERTGFFYEPTVLAGVTPDNPAFYQEFFGPVAQLFIAEDDDAIVALANDSKFGLGGTIYSPNIPRARLPHRIEFSDGYGLLGTVLTNETSDRATGRYNGDPSDFWLRVTVQSGVLENTSFRRWADSAAGSRLSTPKR